MVFGLPRVVLRRRLSRKVFDTQRATDVIHIAVQSVLGSLTLLVTDDNQLEVSHDN